MILSDKHRHILEDILESAILGTPISERHEGLMNDLRPMCPRDMKMIEFLREVARTGRTDSLDPAQMILNPSQIKPIPFQGPSASGIQPLLEHADKMMQDAAGIVAAASRGNASGMREVQARIRQIIKAEPGSGIYMLMLKCYDDPVCKRWYKTSPWLLRVQITNAIRTIIDAEEADVLAFLSGAPVAPSDF